MAKRSVGRHVVDADISCFDQDQPMDVMDLDHLRMRLRGNSLQEKLSALWLEHCLAHLDLPRV